MSGTRDTAVKKLVRSLISRAYLQEKREINEQGKKFINRAISYKENKRKMGRSLSESRTQNRVVSEDPLKGSYGLNVPPKIHMLKS